MYNCFTPGNNSIGGLVGSKAGLDSLEKRKIYEYLASDGNWTLIPGSSSPLLYSLYELSAPGCPRYYCECFNVLFGDHRPILLLMSFACIRVLRSDFLCIFFLIHLFFLWFGIVLIYSLISLFLQYFNAQRKEITYRPEPFNCAENIMELRLENLRNA